MPIKCKSDNVDAISRTFAHWCRRREPNPRYATLVTWAEYNIETSEEVLREVWHKYTTYL